MSFYVFKLLKELRYSFRIFAVQRLIHCPLGKTFVPGLGFVGFL